MGDAGAETPEAARLEGLWRGEFGNAYTERNSEAGTGRKAFWDTLLSKHSVRRVLEVGCNIGANLQWIAPHLAPGDAYGIDINQEALTRLRDRVPNVSAVASTRSRTSFPRWVVRPLLHDRRPHPSAIVHPAPRDGGGRSRLKSSRPLRRILRLDRRSRCHIAEWTGLSSSAITAASTANCSRSSG